MTADDFTEAARAEAERRWSRDQSDGRPLSAQARMNRRVGFDLGARWAAAQEPTDAEQEARRVVEHKHQFHGSQCVCGFETERARTRTEHIMTHYFDEVRTARAARRDEATR